METPSKVLALTKRLSELCELQSMLYSAGLELVTATNLETALGVIRALGIHAVAVCRDSWPEAERERMVSELRALRPELTVIVRCPGCKRCVEPASVGESVEQAAVALLQASPKRGPGAHSRPSSFTPPVDQGG